MIYLDSAATTLIKPRAVAEASARGIATLAGAGRGGHRSAMAAAEMMYACREAASELFNVQDPERVVFTFNATHGLNIAIKSLVRPGDRVIISGYEHNAVVRPLHAVGANIAVAGTELFEPERCAADYERELKRGAAAAIINHVSNVFGYVQPLERVAELCRYYETPLIVDASQSAGAEKLDFSALGAAFMAMPGHKGLYGPQGTGLLLCAGWARPLIEGGTGSRSMEQDMPPELPDRLEAGTQNACGIAGLLEGIKFVSGRGERSIAAHERRLTARLAAKLEGEKRLRLYLALEPELQAGVVSLNVDGIDCTQLAERLSKRGVAVRAGLHCAPLAHKSAGTLSEGTLRVSVSAFTTARDIDMFAEILRSVW